MDQKYIPNQHLDQSFKNTDEHKLCPNDQWSHDSRLILTNERLPSIQLKDDLRSTFQGKDKTTYEKSYDRQKKDTPQVAKLKMSIPLLLKSLGFNITARQLADQVRPSLERTAWWQLVEESRTQNNKLGETYKS